MNDGAGVGGEPGVRRRQVRAVGGRSGRFEVKCTGEQAEQLRAMAAAHGVSVPKLMVDTTLSASGSDLDRAEVLAELVPFRRELAEVAVALLDGIRAGTVGDEGAEVFGWLRDLAGPGGRLELVLQRWAIPPRRATRRAA